MNIKKNSSLLTMSLIFVAIIGFLLLTSERPPITSGYTDNTPKSSNESIVITAPNNSSVWEAGKANWIYYNISIITHVDIDLYKDGIFLMNIAPCVHGTGNLFWQIPPELTSSNLYQIKITDYYNYIELNVSLFDFSDFFEIYNPNQSIDNSIPGYNITILISLIGIVSLIGATYIATVLKRKNKK